MFATRRCESQSTSATPVRPATSVRSCSFSRCSRAGSRPTSGTSASAGSARYDAPAARPGHRPGRRTPARGADPPAARDARRPWRSKSPPSTPAGWRRARSPALLGPLLSDPDLGKHVVAAVADLSSGEVRLPAGRSARPASTTKLLTAAAALHVLGPDHRFTTSVVLDGRGKQRRVVLVGGGDPYLASKPAAKDEPAYPERADLRTLARQTAQALSEQGAPASVSPTTTRSSPDRTSAPHWERSYVTDGVVSRIRALWADEGRPASGFGRVPDPSLTAATYFAKELGAAGIRVAGPPERRRAGDGATPLAEVESAPLSQIVERMLNVSDNEAAEVLAHQVGLATVGEASFAGGVAGRPASDDRAGRGARGRRPVVRRQRAVPRQRARARDAARRAAGRGRRRTPRAAGRCSPGCRSPASPARWSTASSTPPLPHGAASAPRPAPCAAPAASRASRPTSTARRSPSC